VVTQTDGRWGTAQELPGIGPVNSPGMPDGDTTAITCPSAGNCTAAGDYESVANEYCANSPFGPPQGCAGAFVVNERHGTWDQVTAAGAFSYVFSLTCPATGDCVAAGGQANGKWHGVWGKVIRPRGIPTGQFGEAGVNAVACPPKITLCIAGGYETSRTSNRTQAFTVSQTG
jgi:hypothetical protein